MSHSLSPSPTVHPSLFSFLGFYLFQSQPPSSVYSPVWALFIHGKVRNTEQDGKESVCEGLGLREPQHTGGQTGETDRSRVTETPTHGSYTSLAVEGGRRPTQRPGGGEGVVGRPCRRIIQTHMKDPPLPCLLPFICIRPISFKALLHYRDIFLSFVQIQGRRAHERHIGTRSETRRS